MLRGAADLDVEVHCWEQNLIHLTSSNEKVANAVQLTDNGKGEMGGNGVPNG